MSRFRSGANSVNSGCGSESGSGGNGGYGFSIAGGWHVSITCRKGTMISWAAAFHVGSNRPQSHFLFDTSAALRYRNTSPQKHVILYEVLHDYRRAQPKG